jgi:hypothetical protein
MTVFSDICAVVETMRRVCVQLVRALAESGRRRAARRASRLVGRFKRMAGKRG